MFHYMESNNLLDIDSELHMFCLHYVFKSRNHHPLSTEKNLSPIQLWVHGLASNIAAGDVVTEVRY